MLGGIPELIVTTAVTTVLLASFLPMQQNLQDSQLAATAAWEIAAVRDAAAQYIKDNWSTVYASAATPQAITSAALQAGGYLVGAGLNPWRQNHAVLVMQSGVSGLLGVVVSYGGTAIPANRLLTAAALIGKYGAYVPYSTDPSPCGVPCVKGLGTYWVQSLASFNAGATAAYIPTSGHLAAGILFQGGEEAAPWLCRHFQPGNTDCARMYTDIDMNGHSIANAKDVTASEQVATAKFADYNDSTYYVIPSGISNVNMVNAATIVAATSVTSPVYYHSSDARLKDNIRDIEDALRLVQTLKGHRFQWKADGSDDLGLVAQEVQKVLPEAVKMQPDGYLVVKYDILVAPLIEAVKILAGRVDELRGDIGRSASAPGRQAGQPRPMTAQAQQ